MLPSLRRGIPDCAVMDPARVEQIDAASMAILADVWVMFRDEIALADWRRAGAKVVGERVYVDGVRRADDKAQPVVGPESG